jgi:omega-6 fatty acid desaturase (delta-12 desaturase)
LPRHPLTPTLLPPLVFLLSIVSHSIRPLGSERSVWLTDLALVAVWILVTLFGWREVLLIHLPIMVVASILGVWLFSLQHRFEPSRWLGHGDWSFVEAALEGSSYFQLPRALHWLTGNIGFHHVHHLNPRVPNYRLSACHDAVQALRPVRGLSLRGGLGAPRLTLWDEQRRRLVRFADVVVEFGTPRSLDAPAPGV